MCARQRSAPSSTVEVEALLLGHRAEAALDEVLELGERDVARLDLHLAGLDLGQVEDLVDQREQVAARGVDRLARTRPACR